MAVNVAISDPIEKVKPYSERQNFPYPVLYDKDQGAYRAYKVLGTPTVVFVDEKGETIWKKSWVDKDSIRKYLKTYQVKKT